MLLLVKLFFGDTSKMVWYQSIQKIKLYFFGKKKNSQFYSLFICLFEWMSYQNWFVILKNRTWTCFYRNPILSICLMVKDDFFYLLTPQKLKSKFYLLLIVKIKHIKFLLEKIDLNTDKNIWVELSRQMPKRSENYSHSLRQICKTDLFGDSICIIAINFLMQHFSAKVNNLTFLFPSFGASFWFA